MYRAFYPIISFPLWALRSEVCSVSKYWISFRAEFFGIAGGFISYHLKIGQPGLADRKSLICVAIDIGPRDEGVVILFFVIPCPWINTVVYMTLVYDYSMITALAAGEIICFDLEITIVKLENVFFFSKWTFIYC